MMDNAFQRHRQSLLALVIFTALATALIRQAMLPDYALLPLDFIQTVAPWDHLDVGPLANPLQSDPFFQFYPFRYLQTAWIRDGQIPLWNPTILTGSPVFADPPFKPFYIPNLIAALFLPAHRALSWLAWGHLILTGWFMYGFLRQHKLHWLACVLGGGTWMLSAHLVVWLEYPGFLSTLAWLPGIFWAYQKAADGRRLDYAAAGGFLLGLSILGGQLQSVIAMGLLLGLYVVSTMAWDRYEQGQLSPWPLVSFFIIGVVGLGIGAILLIPSMEFAAFSQRGRYTAETILRTRLPWQHIVTLIAPDFYGSPVNPEGYWGAPPNYAELATYFGAVSLLLALSAPFVARWRQLTFAAIIITLFSLAITLGLPLVRLIFLFPGAQFLALSRLLFLLSLSGAWLAAIGLDGWLSTIRRRQWTLVPILFFLIGVTILTLWTQQVTLTSHRATYIDLARSAVLLLLAAGLIMVISHRPRVVGGLLVMLALVDLYQWGWDYNAITPTANLYPENEVVAYLRQDTSPHRVLPLQSEKVVFGPNVLSVFGIETIGGYSSLIQEDYHDLFKAISSQVDFPWLRSSPSKLVMSVFEPMVSLLNVKYVLSAKPLSTDEFLQVDQTTCVATVALGDDLATEAFTATAPGLNRIDILLAPSTASAKVLFRLWRDSVYGDLVAETELLVNATDEPAIHTIYFEPVADSAGQPFVWGISGDGNAAICAAGPDDNLAFSAYGTQLISHGERGGIWIYENPNALPRAYLVHHAETLPADQVLERLVDPDFDFYHSVLLSNPLPEAQSEQLAESPIRSIGEVGITDYDLHQVDLSVSTGRAGILILADASYPGWAVMVDGVKQEVLEVNGVFRGVFLAPGTHTISFQLRPTTLYWGIGLATLSTALALAIFLRSGGGHGRKGVPLRKASPKKPPRSNGESASP